MASAARGQFHQRRASWNLSLEKWNDFTDTGLPDEEYPIRRCSEREPADSLRDKSNVIGGWFPSLTFALAANTRMGYDIHITRAESWTQSQTHQISLEEWLRYVASDAEGQRDPKNSPTDFL